MNLNEAATGFINQIETKLTHPSLSIVGKNTTTLNGLPVLRTDTAEEIAEFWRLANSALTVRFVYVWTVPAFSETLIEHHYHTQRSPDNQKVRRYADDMRNLTWANLDDAISITRPCGEDNHAKTANGNNRAHANRIAGVPILFLFRLGVDPAQVSQFDPTTRKAPEHGLMAGRSVLPTTRVAAAIVLEAADFLAGVASGFGAAHKQRIVDEVSDQDIKNLLDLDSLISGSVIKISYRGTLAIMHRILRDEQDPQTKQRILAFFNAVLSNESTLPEGGDLSNKLINYLGGRVCKGTSRAAVHAQVVGVKEAVDALRRGSTVSKFKRPSEADIEELALHLPKD